MKNSRPFNLRTARFSGSRRQRRHEEPRRDANHEEVVAEAGGSETRPYGKLRREDAGLKFEFGDDFEEAEEGGAVAGGEGEAEFFVGGAAGEDEALAVAIAARG
jgi:hypothetical protein